MLTFSQFSLALATIEPISSRLEITAHLAQLFKQLSPDECLATFNLLQGQLLPPYQALEFQLSEKMVVRTLARLADQFHLLAGEAQAQPSALNIFGEEDLSFLEKTITRQVKESGDLGLTTEKLLAVRSQELVSDLSLNQVYNSLLKIARASGTGSQEVKLQLLQELLSQVDPVSSRFIVRIVVGKMRLGFSLMTILDALSWTMTDSKQESALLETTFQKKADLAQLAQVYLFEPDLQKRQANLDTYQVEVGIPVVSALCQRLNSASDIIDKMTQVYAEPKYDGMRVQIHFSNQVPYSSGQPLIKAFTRNLEDISHMFLPELQKLIQLFSTQSTSFILDSEAVGFNPQTGKLLPFQETITRKRKHDIASKAVSTPVRFYVFDLLAHNGKSLLDRPLTQRKQDLDQLFTDNDFLIHSPAKIISDAEELRQFHERELTAGLEGVVAKQTDSIYQSGRKGWSWVKIKEEEGTRGKLIDTLDLVVLGYYYGKGKRNSFGVGAFLVGIRQDSQGMASSASSSGDSNLGDTDRLLSLSKIGTGLTDDQFRELKNRAEPLVVAHQPSNYEVDKTIVPDVWLAPELIVEIAADEITNSSLHTSGVSLRFPRLIKFRDDKNLSDSTSLQELLQIRTAST